MTTRDFDRLFSELNRRQMRQDRLGHYAHTSALVIVALAFTAAAMVAVGVAG